MTPEKFEELYKEHEEKDHRDEKNRIFKGLQILAKYTDEISINPAHDEIYAGLDDEEYEKMSEADVVEMFELGWRWDDGSFVIFT